MRTVTLIVFFCLIATVASPSPWLVCDPAPTEGRTHFKLTGWTPAQITAQADGSLRMDVASASVGTTNITIAACRNDAIWGDACSVYVPFALVRPGLPSVPSLLRLVAP